MTGLIVFPDILSMAGAMGLILYGAKKLQPIYTAYAAAYFVMAFGATWLLSGMRYTLCLFPIALSMARLTQNKRLDKVFTIVYGVGLLTYTHYFIAGGWSIF